jgi:hypothetical protein
MAKVFLGGTCAETTWRQQIIPHLQLNYFNPVVDDWNDECRLQEIDEKNMHCNVHLYVITSALEGVFSVAEVVDSAHTKGKITILHIIPEGFSQGQLMSLRALKDLVSGIGGIAYIDSDIRRVIRVLNECFKGDE